MQSINANDNTLQEFVTFDVDTDVNQDQVNTQNRLAQAQPFLPTDVSQFGLNIRKSTGLPLLLIPLYSPKDTYDPLFLPNYPTINATATPYPLPPVCHSLVFA